MKAWYRLGLLVTLLILALLGIVMLALSYVEVGAADLVGNGRWQLLADEISDIPEAVVSDARETAGWLYGDSKERYEAYASQLLAMYQESREKDIIVVFNSGGWGWNFVDDSPGWQTILDGITSELRQLGHDTILLNYRRTSENLVAMLKEFIEVTHSYPSKAEDLAIRVDFLTTHLPESRILLTGESNGTVIADRVMSRLKSNPRVFSIQTGTPFWHQSESGARTLIINSNGVSADTFSRGDVPTLLSATIRGIMGLLPQDDDPGMVMKSIRAPGHHYTWNYREVSGRIGDFLNKHFGDSS